MTNFFISIFILLFILFIYGALKLASEEDKKMNNLFKKENENGK